MRAPTSFATIDGIKLGNALVRSPKRAKVVIVIGERGKLFAQLTRSHVAVIIDHGARFAGSRRERPGSRGLKVSVLVTVMGGYRADVGDVLHKALARIVSGKHAVAVTLGQFRNI